MLSKLYSKRQIPHDLVSTWKLKNVKLTGAESRRSPFTEVEGEVGIGRMEERLVKEHKRQLEKSLKNRQSQDPNLPGQAVFACTQCSLYF